MTEGRDPAGARRDPAAVQAEIERVQARLARTIDEITDRTKPANVARRGWEQVRGAGEHLVEEARSLVSGSGAVRLGSHVVEPPEGSVRLKGDDEVVTTYSTRAPLPPELVALGVGVGLAVVVGVVVAWRRRRGH
ncbi:DUF3618 domain-containing protein [Marinactinospora thermotolerans]|uniref:DUF3618 domain-containing protein n=1 Tax=Marinactinospora thermotolerans DSM 45154 TaxID=1122192 RepID=A0A1T4RX05_9ACTN|nr:DUF3618 domain-containing protein [Marinactinospora thermotolerans]SKA20396.1 Protein of unknown function [Marinactinospora thermotolerans DSM 45154]